MTRLAWFAAVIAVVLVGVAIGLRVVGDDPEVWHSDPTTAERTGRDNDYLVAPEGVREADADVQIAWSDLPPRDLLFLFDSIARNAPRTSVVAGSLDAGHITYVQRSLLFGFPDYVSVKVVEQESKTGLAIWSRSRFGYSDMGVNRSRVNNWFVQAGI